MFESLFRSRKLRRTIRSRSRVRTADSSRLKVEPLEDRSVPAVGIASAGTPYVQNFDGLPGSGTFAVVGTAPLDLSASPTLATGTGPGDWSFANQGTVTAFQVDDGSSTTGAVDSFGTAGSAERALGLLNSASNSSTIGAVLVNNTGANVNSVLIAYDGEQWRNGGSNNSDTLAFSYSVGGTDIETGTFTTASSLSFSSKQTSATPAALNGNAAADRGLVTATLSGLNWAPGQTLVVRWSENSPAGASGGPDGLAVDNFVVGTSPTTVYVGSGFTQDPGTTANVPGGTATVGYNAFSTIAQAQAAIGSTGTIVLTSGIYTSGGSLTPTQTLALADAAAATFAASVTLGAGGILHYEGADPASLSFASGSLVFGGAESVDVTGSGTLTINGSATGAFGLTTTGTGRAVFATNNALNATTGITASAGTLGVANITLSKSRIMNIAAGAFVESSGTINTTADGSLHPNVEITGAGTLKLTSTTDSPTVPDIYFNSNDTVQGNSTANWGTGIGANIDLGSSNRYIFGLTDHNGFGEYGTSTDVFISGNISGAGGLTFIAQDNYTSSNPIEVPFVLAGTNTFGGGVTIQRGSVYIDSPGGMPSGSALLLDPISGQNARFYLFGNNVTLSSLSSTGAGTSTIANGPGDTVPAATLTVNQSTNTTFAGPIVQVLAEYSSAAANVGNLSLVKSGSGSLTLAGTDAYTGATTIAGGVLNIAADNGLGTAPSVATPGDLVLAGGSLNVSAAFVLNANRGIALGPTGGAGSFAVNVASGTLTYAGIITDNGGSGTLAVSGNVSLGGANTYSGGTTLESGEIFVGNSGALGTGTFTVTTGAAATFLDATALPAGTNTIANNIVLPNDATSTNRTIVERGSAPNVLILSGVLSGGGPNTTLFSNTNVSGDSGAILRLTGANTFVGASGDSLNLNRGVLQIDPDAALGAPGNTLELDSNGANRLVFTNSITDTHATLLVASGSYDTQGNNVTSSGTISGSAAFTKLGTGSLTVTNGNTYAGGTNISAGALILANAAGSATGTGPVNVPAGTILAGAGSASGSVTVTGTLSPGIGAGNTGALTVGGASFAIGGVLALDINSLDGAGAGQATSGYDQLNVTGPLNLTNAVLNANLTTTPALGTAYTIINNTGTGAVTGTFNGLAEGAFTILNQQHFQISYVGGDGNDVTLTRKDPPPVYVDATWAGFTLGQVIQDADPVAAGNQPATFGTNAFAAMHDALQIVQANGNIIVNGGNYPEAVVLDQQISITVQASAVQIAANQPGAASFQSLADTVSTASIFLSGAKLSIGDAGNETISSTVIGTGSIDKTGSGTLTLAAQNSFGGLTVDGGAVALTGTNTFTGGLTVNAGQTTLGATDTFAGGVTINGGDVQVGQGGTTESLSTSSIFLGSAGTLEFLRSDQAYNLAVPVSGSGTLAFLGTNATAASAYTLSGNNSAFAGTVMVASNVAGGNGARLAVASGTALGSATVDVASQSQIFLTGGSYANAFNIAGNGWAETAGTLGAIRLSGAAKITSPVDLLGNARITDFASGDSGTIAGPITGAFALEKTGAGPLTLGGSNTQASTTDNGGEILIANIAALGTGTYTVTTAAAGTFLDTSALTGAQNLVNNLVLPADTTATNRSIVMRGGAGNVLQLSGVISGGSTFTTLFLNSNTGGDGQAAFRLSGINTFVGNPGTGAASSVVVNRGQLQIDSDAALGGPANSLYMDSNAPNRLTFENPMTFTHNMTFGTAATLDLGASAVTTTGIFSGTAGMTKIGTGTLTLAGTSTYSGGTTIQAGIVSIASLADIGASTGALAIQNGSTLLYTGSGTESLSGPVSWNNGSATIDVVQASADVILFCTGGNTSAGGGTFTKSGDGTLTYSTSVAADFGKPVAVTDGTFALAASIAGANLTIASTFTGAAGTQIDILPGDGAVGNAGLAADWSANLASLDVASGATFDLGGNQVRVDALTGAGTIMNGDWQAGSGIVGDTLTLGVGGDSGSFSGNITGSGTSFGSPGQVSVVKTGGGTETFAGASDYGGSTTVVAGTLGLANTSGSATGSSAVTIAGGAFLNGNGSSSSNIAVQSGGAIAGSGSYAAVAVASGGLIEGAGTFTSVSLAGTVSGSGSFNSVVVASGGLISGSGTFGSVTLAGTITGSGSFGTVVVDGGTIAGNGAFMSITGNGSLSPGTTPGGAALLDVGSASFSSGSSLTIDINDPTGNPVNAGAASNGFDQIDTTGSINLTNVVLNVNLTVSPAIGTSYTILNNTTGQVTGNFVGLPEGAFLTVGSQSFRISYVGGDGNDVTLTRQNPSVIYVDSTWSTLPVGTMIADADPVTPGSQAAVIGTNAFASVNAAIAAAPTNATVLVSGGAYNEAVVIDHQIKLAVQPGLAQIQASQPGDVTFTSLSDTVSTATVDLDNATLTIGDGNTETLLSSILGTGGLHKVGSGTLVLAGPSAYSGATVLDAGTVIVGIGTTLSGNSTNLTVNAGAVLELNGSNVNLTSLTGAGTIENDGSVPSTITMSSTAANVNLDVLLRDSSSFSAPLGVTQDGSGTLTLTQTADSFTGPITINSGTLAVVGGGQTLAAPIAGAGAFAKIGAGSLTLGGMNGYSGPTTVSAGTLTALPGSYSSLSAQLTVSPGALLQLEGSTANLTSLTGAGTIENGSSSDSTINLDVASGTAALDALLRDSSTGTSGRITLVKNGSGSLTITQPANSYTGGTTVNGGTLSVAVLASGGLPSSIGASNSGSGSLVLAGGATLLYTGPDVTIDRSLTVNTGGATINVAAGSALTTSGMLVGGSEVFAKAGAGRLVFTQSNALATGNISVTGGTLGTSDITLSLSRTITIAAGAFVESSGTIDTTADGSVHPNVQISGAGTLKLVSTTDSATTPDIFFNSNDSTSTTSTANWGTSISAAIDLGSSPRYIWGTENHSGFGEYGSSADVFISGNISGAGGITFIGQNQFTSSPTMEVPFVLAGNDTFTGGITIQRGSVYIDGPNAMPSGSAVLMDPISGQNARLYLYGNSITLGSLASTGAGTSTIANAPGNTIPAATLTINQSTNTTYSGAIVQVQAEYSSAAPVVGNLGLVKAGSGTLTLAGTNAYTGSTTVLGGTLQLQASALPASTNLTLAAGAVFDLDGVSQTLASLADSGTTGSVAGSVINSAPTTPATLTLNPTSGSFAFSGAISDAGAADAISLLKSGSGTEVFAGNSTYSGPTAVSAGALLVNGSLSAASPVTVALGATLGGSGSVGNVVAPGVVDPGVPGSPGTLSVGGLAIGTGNVGTLHLDIGSTTAFDSVNVAAGGAVDITGTTLALTVGTVGNGDTFTILHVPASVGSSRIGTFDNLPASGSLMTVGSVVLSINYVGGPTGTDVVLTVVSGGTGATLVGGGPVLNGASAYIDSTLATKQHSMVENVVYSFSQAVALTAADFTLSGIQGTSLVPNVNVSSAAGGAVWTVTFSGAGVNAGTHSIGDGEYQLVLGGVPGMAASTYDFFRLLGDMDGDGTVSAADFSTLISTFLRSTTDPLYLGADDFDGDHTIGASDLSQFTASFLHTVPPPLPN